MRARQVKRAGLALSSCLALSSALALGLQAGELRAPDQLPAPVWAGGAALALLYILTQQSGLQAELHNGRLYVSWGGPLSGPPVEPHSIEVHLACVQPHCRAPGTVLQRHSACAAGSSQAACQQHRVCHAQPRADGCCQVRPSGPGRGNGAFAVRDLPRGVYLGAYEGELIDEATYWARYPSGKVLRPASPAWCMACRATSG